MGKVVMHLLFTLEVPYVMFLAIRREIERDESPKIMHSDEGLPKRPHA